MQFGYSVNFDQKVWSYLIIQGTWVSFNSISHPRSFSQKIGKEENPEGSFRGQALVIQISFSKISFA
jgi:hypothetical protein